MEESSAVFIDLTLLNDLYPLSVLRKLKNYMKNLPVTQYYLTLLNYLQLFFKL